MDAPADMSLETFVEALGSARPTPGSGAAAAVCLALAAGCLSKSLAITLRHRPDPALERLADEARALAGAALAGAREEAEAFRRLLRAHDPATVADNVEIAEALRTCAAALLALADRTEPAVVDAVAADVIAARQLIAAADAILAGNAREATARTGP